MADFSKRAFWTLSAAWRESDQSTSAEWKAVMDDYNAGNIPNETADGQRRWNYAEFAAADMQTYFVGP